MSDAYDHELLLDDISIRIPVVLCIDVSSSMGTIDEGNTKNRLELVKQGISMMYKEILDNDDAADAIELAIVTYSDDAYVIRDFKTLNENDNEYKSMHLVGGAYMGKGLEKALELLENRIRKYKECLIDYYQPILIVMSDGYSSSAGLDAPTRKCREMHAHEKLTAIPVFLGPLQGGNTTQLEALHPEGKVYNISDMAMILELFRWIAEYDSIAASGEFDDTEKLFSDLFNTLEEEK